MLFPHEPP